MAFDTRYASQFSIFRFAIHHMPRIEKEVTKASAMGVLLSVLNFSQLKRIIQEAKASINPTNRSFVELQVIGKASV